MNQWWKRIQQLLGLKSDQSDPERTSQTNQTKKEEKELSFSHWILILIALGLAAVILSNYFSKEEEAPKTFSNLPLTQEEMVDTDDEAIVTFGTRSQFTTLAQYEEELENKLKEMLSKIKGVGEVSVMINLDSTQEMVVEKNVQTQESTTEERDREGGNRQIKDQQRNEQVVILRQGNHEQPIVVKTTKPPVRGVLVLAPGATDVQVKAWISEAVQRVLDVPPHKVSVLPKNQ